VLVFQFSYLCDAERDEFQNLISCSLSTDTSVITFSRTSIQWFICKVADRLTNKQTNAGLRSLLGRGN